jgi:hypothetical protein
VVMTRPSMLEKACNYIQKRPLINVLSISYTAFTLVSRAEHSANFWWYHTVVRDRFQIIAQVESSSNRPNLFSLSRRSCNAISS